MTDNKIPYQQLKTEYPGKLVALSADETQVLENANSFKALLKKLEEKDIDPQNCIYIGPLPEAETISV